MEKDYKGLENSKAEELLKTIGLNELEQKEKVSAFKLFMDQLKSPLIILLLVASVVSLSLNISNGVRSIDEYLDTILILIIVLLSALAGFFQDFKAEKAVEALQKMSSPKTKVIRDGVEKIIDSKFIVPGDIVVLDRGDIIPADGEILDQKRLEINESSLTGESAAVKKKEGDEVSMNTFVDNGHAFIKITETGMHTKMGKIAKGLAKNEEEDFFKKEISEISRKLVILSSVIIVVIAAIGYFKFGLVESIMLGLSLAVAAIPEGLPAVVTLTLAIASKKMVKHNALLRKLSVAEVLGSVNIICTDKTGTLTKNEMTVLHAYTYGKIIETESETNISKDLEKVFVIGGLCNNSLLGEDENGVLKYLGEQTEIALRRSAEKYQLQKEEILKKGWKITDEIPFSSSRKMMSIVVEHDDQKELFSKGAPEVILGLCNRILMDGEVKELTDQQREEILGQNKTFASNALRVLGFAYKETEGEPVEKDLIFVGLQAMIDPPRPEVAEAIQKAKSAGIETIMITGDNPQTAIAIANSIGFNSSEALTGNDLENMSDDEIYDQIKKGNRVFARTSPFHKERILSIVKANGNIAAMTGDGVNDALALHKADVGIAMGIRGTEVSKQASDMVLLDDNYATIIKAIEQGRTVFVNIRKFIDYLLTCNVAEVLLVALLTIFVDLKEPILLPIQLLWINLLTDGLVALALGLDKPLPSIMNIPPRPKSEPILNNKLYWMIGSIGVKKMIVLVVLFLIARPMGVEISRTILLTGIVMFEFVRIGAIRYEYHEKFNSNKFLTAALLLSLLLHILIIYLPVNSYFYLVPLDAYAWMLLIAGTLIGYFLAILITRLIINKFGKII